MKWKSIFLPLFTGPVLSPLKNWSESSLWGEAGLLLSQPFSSTTPHCLDVSFLLNNKPPLEKSGLVWFVSDYCRLLDSSLLTTAPQSLRHLWIPVSTALLPGWQALDAPLSMTGALCRAAGESLGSRSRAALPAVLPSEALQAAGESLLLLTAWNRLIRKIPPGFHFTYTATAVNLKLLGGFGHVGAFSLWVVGSPVITVEGALVWVVETKQVYPNCLVLVFFYSESQTVSVWGHEQPSGLQENTLMSVTLPWRHPFTCVPQLSVTGHTLQALPQRCVWHRGWGMVSIKTMPGNSWAEILPEGYGRKFARKKKHGQWSVLVLDQIPGEGRISPRPLICRSIEASARTGCTAWLLCPWSLMPHLCLKGYQSWCFTFACRKSDFG